MWQRILSSPRNSPLSVLQRTASQVAARYHPHALCGLAPLGTTTASAYRFRSTSTHDSNDRPFDRVLIANRGEIALRVMKTCHALGIETVAIYSTADAQAPFVQAATHAVCVGPTAASASYLNVEAVLDAVRETGAQAVHPGYGFLSENAKFATSVQEAGAVWLGPPPHAVWKLGDKLESKQIASDANVTIIPGYDSPVESMEQALDLCNNKIGYPVLLKAASGGGGKGMRVCHNDQDIKESWGIAKSEAMKFFSDDRLLLEKYIVNPHHIEFQVLASSKAEEVVVFPERECSIQRRNQKVIEETPSTLLDDATRQAMAAQVKQLCQVVGYESAGTVEWLVDENLNFYFLEMNTRLQVEHPVSESVCGVDLVKGMLWVGAGWGLPPEFQLPPNQLILPHKGHAIEARIYAEDPLRGFLPSTGPLSTYVEPNMAANTADRYLRLDSGVVAGQAITPHYDPMLSKIIYYAPTRLEAIHGLSQAMDEYVIQGVQHNARLVQSVLRHPEFQAGHTPTSFLPRHYPDGFQGVQLTDAEEAEFAVAAVMIEQARRELKNEPPLAGTKDGDTVVVKLGGLFGQAYMVTVRDNAAVIRKLLKDEGDDKKSSWGPEETVRLDARVPLVYEPERYLATCALNGKTRSLQVLEHEDHGIGELWMQMYGAECAILVQSVREHELSKYMHEPVALDTSNLVLSPMPGTLLSYAVQPGDTVQPGQELCVVEAMKMQNIIRSPRLGVIATCKVAVGSSLKADEIILELEAEGDAEGDEKKTAA